MKTLIALGCATAATLPLLSNDPAPAATPEGGTVVGTFKWGEKDIPELKPLSIAADKSKGCCPEGVSMNTQDRSLVIGEDKGVANVVVVLEPKGPKIEMEVREEPYLLDQTLCRFEPHVLVVPAGATVRYLNSDEVNHNVNSTSRKNPRFNNTIAKGGADERVLEHAEQIKVACDIHPWMNAWVYVTDAPYFGTTDERGNVEIKDVKPGDYRVSWWHEKLGKGNLADVTVTADGKATFEHELKESAAGGGRRRRR